MHGAESVVLSDIVRPDDELLQKGINHNDNKYQPGISESKELSFKDPVSGHSLALRS